jgi:hypothetical protein
MQPLWDDFHSEMLSFFKSRSFDGSEVNEIFLSLFLANQLVSF